MGTSAEAAAETRRNIVKMAAVEFKARGFRNVGVADLLSQLGLTHGGFYRHFENKDQLVAEACKSVFDNIMTSRWPKNCDAHTKDAMSQIVTRYLSAKDRDNPTDSCGLASLVSDFARASDDTRIVATEGFRKFVALLEKAVPLNDAKTMNEEATNLACLLIGTMSMAKVFSDRKMSNNLLSTVKSQILTSYEDRY